MDDNFIDVYEGDIHVKVRRGSSWDHIERVLALEKKRLELQKLRDNYFKTHGPLNYCKWRCEGCSKSFAEIHATRLVCEEVLRKYNES